VCFASIWSSAAAALSANPTDKDSYENSTQVGMRFMEKGVELGRLIGKNDAGQVRREFFEAGLTRMESFDGLKGADIRSQLLKEADRASNCIKQSES
jgi:hypothetical protein